MRLPLFLLCCLGVLSSAIAQSGASASPRLLGSNPQQFTGAAQALGQAIAGQHTGTIKQLIQQHPNWLNRPDSTYGQTPLTFAIWNGWGRSVTTLLDLGADPNLRNTYNGHTPLIEAVDALRPAPSLVPLLLTHGADPNQVATRNAHTHFLSPLIAAAGRNNLPVMRQLVAAGANPHLPMPNGRSLLFTASLSPQPELVYYCVAELHADATQQLLTDAQGQPVYLVNMMRNWLLPLDSPEYQQKMKLADYLKTQGIDYRSAPIPARRAANMTPEYRDRY